MRQQGQAAADFASTRGRLKSPANGTPVFVRGVMARVNIVAMNPIKRNAPP
jgi:hypothetical protein